MATSVHLYRPILTAVGTDSRRHVPTRFLPLANRNVTPRLQPILSLEVGKEVASTSSSTVNMEELVGFLYKDLPHLFDDQGIDTTAYDERVKFRDPITKHDTISGPYEITTRWTMVMKFMLLPWKPELVFTGTSIMEVNPQTKKFCSHLDLWDSINNNDYFSLEGLVDVFKQLRIYKTPDLETPKYQILKRRANYEVRKYEPFIVVETNGDKLSGSSGFNNVAGYIFGKNSTTEKISMTTPVFTQTTDAQLSADVSVQIVIPSGKDLSSLPAPNEENIKLKQMEGGFAAAIKFSGKPTEDVVRAKEIELRNSLSKDGLRAKKGCMLARYNDPGRTWNFIMRNEVIIWLEDFSLD